MTAARRLRALVREHPAESVLWAAAVLLRVPLLNAKSLWLDESVTLLIARAPLSQTLGLVRGIEKAPPLHYLLAHAWIGLFADQILGLRVLSLLFGLGALALFHRACARLIPRQATLALAIGAFSSYWIDVSQSGRAYGLFLLLAAAAFRLHADLRERWRTGPGLAYAAVGALGLYTHYFFAFVLLGQLADAAWRRRRRPAELAPWAAAALFWAAAFAPWLPAVASQFRGTAGGTTIRETFDLAQLASLFGGLFANVSVLGFVLGPWVRAAGALVLVFLAGAAFLKGDREARVSLVLQLIVPLGAVKAVELALGQPVTQLRYFVFLSLPAYALASLLVGRLARGPREAAAAVLAVLLAAGVVGYDYSCLYLDSRLDRLSGSLRAAARPGDVVVHLNPFYYASLRYYYLPEIPQFVLDEKSPLLNWKALPGYDPVIPDGTLAALPRVLIVDPDRRLFPRRVGEATGAQLESLRRRGL